MGVPAFYRWLSEKYPKIVVDVLQERVQLVEGSYSQKVPFDGTRPNPNGIECNNLYIDMNGIIHPCSHPENGPQPASEEEMYENICAYVDHLMRVHRPRSLLFLAIDGVAPRAKMNQQRARRFRAAQEARELAALEKQIRCEVFNSSDDDDNDGSNLEKMKEKEESGISGAWDSNVITPGTPFMINLAEYIRFYIRLRISTNPAWKTLKVIFSDASVPGEGEHKIMNHIRCQRACPGYNPNTVHILHGLDADLIMLALATHEVHFYISREEVTFGRKSEEMKERRQLESGYKQKQQEYDEQTGAAGMQIADNQHKPIQLLSIPILREYIAIEFESLIQRIPFQPVSLERLIDDFVFMCFFVGNDFLPHLPSLDIRDGALDFLLNVYQRILPTLGDYITRSGGLVNLSHVDILLSEVGQIEDYVFRMKYETEQVEKRRREEMDGNRKARTVNNKNEPPVVSISEQPKVRGRAAKILEKQQEGSGESTNDSIDKSAVALKSTRKHHVGNNHIRFDDHGNTLDDTNLSTNTHGNNIAVSHIKKTSNHENENAAQALKLALENAVTTDGSISNDYSGNNTMEVDDENCKAKTVRIDVEESKEEFQDLGKAKDNQKNAYGVKRGRIDDGVVNNAEDVDVGLVGSIEEEFDADDDNDIEDEDAPKIDEIVKKVDPKLALIVKEKVKSAQQKQLDEYAKSVVDNVRLHEDGWKDRYYTDKCKADDVNNHGGREHLFRSYVMGLCWVMKYYYDGVPSWKWYYPFHYGPFASDLRNIERFEKDCKSFEISVPFNPVEQLMAVLPVDSSHAIPKASRWLMSDPESPIIDFYPIDVPVDPNGKAMPWLWVVLLPFIDEERLLTAMSPTMAKWTQTELLCNARGLDDGYLYLHRSAHVLSNKLSSILIQAKDIKGASKVRLTNASQYGISGSIRAPLKNEFFPPDEDLVAPLPRTASKINSISVDTIFSDPIDPNEAVCVAFTEPPKLSHKSNLLPGVKIPSPSLIAPEDRLIRRPRINRFGGSIANMGGGGNGSRQGQSYQSGYGSMNISQYERDLARQNGRSNEMYQAGTRSWGSMEPAPKRFHVGPPQGPPPPPPSTGQHRPLYPPVSHGGDNYREQQHEGTRNEHNRWGHPEQSYYQQQSRGGLNSQQPSFRNQVQQVHPPPAMHFPAYQQLHGSGSSGLGQHGGRGHASHIHTNQQRHYQQFPPPPPRPPPPSQPSTQQLYAHSFRSAGNQYAPQHQQHQHQHHQHQHQQHHQQQQQSRYVPRANADVINSLRAQLTSTLQHQNRNKNVGSNRGR